MLLFFVLALNIQIFVEGLSCTPSIPTISYVSSCPKNKEDWEAAAKRKKCDTIVQSCTASIQFQYHCLINQWLNATLEVCAPTYYLQGYCASYSIQRKQIVENYEEGYECLNYRGSDKCPRRYLSNEAYKYQPCYTFVSKHETETTAPTTATTTATTLAKEPRSDDNSAVGIVVGIVLVLVVLGLVILICWFRKTIYSKLCKREEVDLEEGKPEEKTSLTTPETNAEVGNLEEEQDKENVPLITGKTNTGTEIQLPHSGDAPKAERVNVDIKETSDIEEEKEAKKTERYSEITDRSLDKDNNETGADIETMGRNHKPSTDIKERKENTPEEKNLRSEDKISVERQEDTSTDKNLRKQDKLAVERQEDTPVDKSEVAKELEKKENTSTIMKIQEGGDKLEKDDNVERHDDTSMSKNSRNEDKVAVERQEDTSTDKNLKKEDKLAKERQEDTPVHIDKKIQEGDDKLAIQSKDITGNIEDSTVKTKDIAEDVSVDSEKDDKVAVKKQEDTSRSKTIEGKEVTNNIQDSTVRTTDTTEEVSVDLGKDDKVEGEIQEDTLRSKIQTKDIIEDVSTVIQEGDDKLDTEKDDKVEEERQEDTLRSKNLKKEDKVPVQKQEDISLDKNVRKEDKEAIEKQEDTCVDKTVESKEDTSNIQDSTAQAKDITESISLGAVTKEEERKEKTLIEINLEKEKDKVAVESQENASKSKGAVIVEGERKEKTPSEINLEKEKDKVAVESQENASKSKVQTKHTIEDTPIDLEKDDKAAVERENISAKTESEEINIQGSTVQNNVTPEDASIGIRTEPKERNEKTSTDINQEKDLKGQDTEGIRPLKPSKKRAPAPPGTFPLEAAVEKLTELDKNIVKDRKMAPPRPTTGPKKTANDKSTDADTTDNNSIPQRKRRAPDPPPQN